MPAQAPRPGAGRRAAAADAAVSFEIGDRTFTFRVNELSGRLSKDCRQTTGYSPMQILGMMDGGALTADLDILAAFMWLCERQEGLAADYDELLDLVNIEWLSTYEKTEDHAEPDPDLPEV